MELGFDLKRDTNRIGIVKDRKINRHGDRISNMDKKRDKD